MELVLTQGVLESVEHLNMFHKTIMELELQKLKEIGYRGSELYHKKYMFGDNQTVAINSAIPYSSLNKKHNASS
jgi:hypothetical protein